jgi:hypothetical protein
MSIPQDFSSAIGALMEVLDGGPPGMIIGGVAVIALGFPRTTVDIDATVWIPLGDLDALVRRLGRAGIEPRMEAAIDFAKTNHVLLMKHRDSGAPIDISLAVLPFEEEAIARRRMIDVGGLRMAIPRVDDLLVYKMVASRPQDLRDVEELLLRYVDTVDLPRSRRLVAEFGAVLERPEMLITFDRLVALARGSGES